MKHTIFSALAVLILLSSCQKKVEDDVSEGKRIGLSQN
jgi:nitrous oxide reductase accessory protein NosL